VCNDADKPDSFLVLAAPSYYMLPQPNTVVDQSEAEEEIHDTCRVHNSSDRAAV